MNRCITTPAGTVSAEQKELMWALFERHYSRAEKQHFINDLKQKDTAFLLYKDDRLIGFNSLVGKSVGPYRVVYSGDMLIEASERGYGSRAFFAAFSRAVFGVYDWWCALSSGPRTHRLLHTFAKRVVPGPGVETSPAEQELLLECARQVYADGFDAAAGIVRTNHPYILRDAESEIRAHSPVDRLFQELNPGWVNGDELVSLVSLQPDNWKPSILRIMEQTQDLP